MVSLILATVFPGVSRVASPLPNSILKPCCTAGNRTGEYRRPNAVNINTVPTLLKPRLVAASTSVAETEIINGEKTELQEAEVIPKHVAIIMDGNGRWAQNRGLTVQDGHKFGLINLKYVASDCSQLGVKLLSVYAFSTENWTRSKLEVDFLMRAFEDFIHSIVRELVTRHDMRFSTIGDKSRLPEYLQAAMCSAEKMSEANKGMHFVMALSYSGRDDVVEAAKRIATKVEDGSLQAREVDESVLSKEMMTGNLEFPDPDLLIRTSGELRISNFLLWQSAYTEFYFTDKMFPDFGVVQLLEAITSYQCRKRRFGRRKN